MTRWLPWFRASLKYVNGSASHQSSLVGWRCSFACLARSSRSSVLPRAVEPAAVLPTRFGPVKIDVLEVRQAELDHPSDDAGDALRRT